MSLKMLILAIVGSEPATGYEITKEFDAVAGYFWRATHQQVYHELAALAEDGMVRFKVVAQEGRPDKKIHSITAKGRKAFMAWFAQPQEIPRVNDPLMIKFFAGERGGIMTLREQLALVRQQRSLVLRTFEAIEREHYSEDIADMPRWKQLICLTLRWGLERERAWLRWSAECERVLRAKARRVSASHS